MKMVINRQKQNNKQIIGTLFVIDDNKICLLNKNESIIFDCLTLELPNKNNQKNISRIPAGIYQVRKRYSEKHQWHFKILDVPGRTYILIHAGNFYTDIEGCVLVGDKLKDINKDGFQDVLNSRKTLDKILEIVPDQFELRIYDEKT